MSLKKIPLQDTEISTVAHPARRRVLGLVAFGGAVAATGTPALAQGADVDNGAWTDSGSCPRGIGGDYTGITDVDNGQITDAGGYGRGEPYC